VHEVFQGAVAEVEAMLNFVREVQPMYDTANQEWVAELDGCEITACSARELKRKLPQGAVILDYYPNGYDVRRPKPDDASRPLTLPSIRSWGVGPRHMQRVKNARVLTADSQPVQETVIAPVPAVEPAPALQGDTMAPVERRGWFDEPATAPLPRKRKPYVLSKPVLSRGPRMYPTRGWTAEEDQHLLQLVQQGFSSYQIAEQLFNRSRNAVIGRCHRKGYQLQGNMGRRPKN
jgi:hypothetical protein